MAREIQLTVQTDDKSFQASLSFPIGATPEEIERIAAAWVNMLRSAIQFTQQQGDKSEFRR